MLNMNRHYSSESDDGIRAHLSLALLVCVIRARADTQPGKPDNVHHRNNNTVLATT